MAPPTATYLPAMTKYNKWLLAVCPSIYCGQVLGYLGYKAQWQLIVLASKKTGTASLAAAWERRPARVNGDRVASASYFKMRSLPHLITFTLFSPIQGWTEVARRAIEGYPAPPPDPHGIHIIPSNALDMGRFRPPEWDGFVYRGDPRTPSEIEGAKGFYPKPAGPMAKPGLEPEWVNPYSLYSHVMGKIEKTKYVSTTLDPNRAAFYAHNSLHAPGNEGRETSFVYQIESDGKNMIDINRSLRLWTVLPNQEVAAMDGIAWSSVKGWAELTRDQLSAINSGKAKIGDSVSSYTPNPQHVPASHPGMSARPHLAGWPADSKAWTFEPWRRIRARNGGQPVDVKERYEKIMAACGKSSSLDGTCLGAVKRPSPPSPGKQAIKGPSSGNSRGKTVVAPSSPCKGGCRVTLASVPAGEKKLFARGLKNFEAMYDHVVFRGLRDRASLAEPVYGRHYAKSSQSVKAHMGAAGKGLAAGALVGLPLSVVGIVDAFTHNFSDARKAAAVLSVVPIPFVSCSSQLAVYADEYDEVSKDPVRSVATPVDIGFCAVADFLLFTPLMPLGVFIHAVRFMASPFLAGMPNNEGPTLDQVMESRYQGWKPIKTQLELLFFGDEWRHVVAERRENATAYLATTLSLAKAVLDEEMANLTASDWRRHNAVVDSIWDLEGQFCVAKHKVDEAWRRQVRDSAEKMVLDLSKSFQDSWCKIVNKEILDKPDIMVEPRVPARPRRLGWPQRSRSDSAEKHPDPRQRHTKTVFRQACNTALNVTDTLEAVMSNVDFLLGSQPDLTSNKSCLSGKDLWPDVKKIWPSRPEDSSPDVPPSARPVASCQQPCQGNAVLKIIESSEVYPSYQCYHRRQANKLPPQPPLCCPFARHSLARVTDRLRPFHGWENGTVCLGDDYSLDPNDPSGATRFALLEREKKSKSRSLSSFLSASSDLTG
ncbi:putative heat-labile enterotoxin [Ophiocordyceps polyrhachis-furcata BCC 54312]|uniref:Heat-labile enterotoxin n=1 Tax=Ophiocordyceps polyrhachis-furcata BCC 54312 TaxID=1330021 RepID=A0A367LQU1_9HYPO|nr:putative heat-labile enterotoxin [Ophiocordyceps polyrhachis-furcata BCC 54312]